MPIDAADAACDAIAEHFGALAGIASGQRGWPEHHQDLDLTGGPVVTVTFLYDERDRRPPVRVSTSPSLFRIADLLLFAQLDLWSPSRFARDTAGAVVEDGMHNQIPRKHGLYLASTGYWNRPLTVEAVGHRADEQPADAEVGEFRRRWQLRIWSDLVVQADAPSQVETILQTTVAGTAEPDEPIT